MWGRASGRRQACGPGCFFRISGLILVFYLGAHIIVISTGQFDKFDALMKTFDHPLAVILDLALVVAVLYHALNGVRIILMDFGIGIQQAQDHVLERDGRRGHLLRGVRVRGVHLHRDRRGGELVKAETHLHASRRHVVLAVPADHRRPSHRLPGDPPDPHAHHQHRRDRHEANVAARLAERGLTAVDIILLAAGIYHALNGLRMVLMDYWFNSRTRALYLTCGLWVIGLVAFGYGMWALWPYIG